MCACVLCWQRGRRKNRRWIHRAMEDERAEGEWLSEMALPSMLKLNDEEFQWILCVFFFLYLALRLRMAWPGIDIGNWSSRFFQRLRPVSKFIGKVLIEWRILGWTKSELDISINFGYQIATWLIGLFISEFVNRALHDTRYYRYSLAITNLN